MGANPTFPGVQTSGFLGTNGEGPIAQGEHNMAEIDISTSSTPAADAVKRGPGRPAGSTNKPRDGDKVRILIPKTKDQTRDVFVKVNDTPYLIKRGVATEVPASVAHALELAVQTDYEEVVDPITGRKDLIPQQTMSVPFQYA